MKKLILILLTLTMLMTAFAGCAGTQEEPQSPTETQAAAPEETQEAVPQEASSETVEPSAPSQREDGERFESVIMIEGMEESVFYEHVKNAELGFEMDYDYELFVRESKADRELFISAYDDIDDPENYLDVTYSAQDADTVAAMMTEALSAQYKVVQETRELDNAGTCILLDASEVKEGGVMAEYLQTVYIIPAEDGCRIATAHCVVEGAEGFLVRMSGMVNTLIVTER